MPRMVPTAARQPLTPAHRAATAVIWTEPPVQEATEVPGEPEGVDKRAAMAKTVMPVARAPQKITQEPVALIRSQIVMPTTAPARPVVAAAAVLPAWC